MSLLIDMNLSPRPGVADAGFEAAHWSTLGPPNAPDGQILAFARTNDYVVLTHDLDFGSILAARRGDKPSVVQIRADDVNPDAIGAVVATALHSMRAEPEQGELLTIDPMRMRVRLLPVRP